MGFTVVGKPPATVITSSPAFNLLSPSRGEVNEHNANKFAELPELVKLQNLTPKDFANFDAN